MRVNKAIKIILIEQGMSCVDLARVLGINRATVTRNVGENANPTLSTLVRYADALNVKVSYIILKSEELECKQLLESKK